MTGRASGLKVLNSLRRQTLAALKRRPFEYFLVQMILNYSSKTLTQPYTTGARQDDSITDHGELGAITSFGLTSINLGRATNGI